MRRDMRLDAYNIFSQHFGYAPGYAPQRLQCVFLHLLTIQSHFVSFYNAVFVARGLAGGRGREGTRINVNQAVDAFWLFCIFASENAVNLEPETSRDSSLPFQNSHIRQGKRGETAMNDISGVASRACATKQRPSEPDGHGTESARCGPHIDRQNYAT